jgi:hypothetical protein
MKVSEFSQFMPVDVFRGGGTGNLVLCQEWPSMNRGERYVRIMVPMNEARELAEAILAVARESGA